MMKTRLWSKWLSQLGSERAGQISGAKQRGDLLCNETEKRQGRYNKRKGITFVSTYSKEYRQIQSII